ncbi:hypothetical protein AYI68_g3984 [Smittium mucronatum]|uniref:Uncharacterized protein n=1 Tax=Smittium mucronatum TaxID=133383 RepID=A0A1R0GYD5_9FUNG|nr:hypothetical protein AYI68_g3984 [Smittium mucronatum]
MPKYYCELSQDKTQDIIDQLTKAYEVLGGGEGWGMNYQAGGVPGFIPPGVRPPYMPPPGPPHMHMPPAIGGPMPPGQFPAPHNLPPYQQPPHGIPQQHPPGHPQLGMPIPPGRPPFPGPPSTHMPPPPITGRPPHLQGPPPPFLPSGLPPQGLPPHLTSRPPPISHHHMQSLETNASSVDKRDENGNTEPIFGSMDPTVENSETNTNNNSIYGPGRPPTIHPSRLQQ